MYVVVDYGNTLSTKRKEYYNRFANGHKSQRNND